MKLLISQRDTIYDLIEKAGLTPSEFQFRESESLISDVQIATKLVYGKGEYFFSFETGPQQRSSHYAVFCPGVKTHTESEYPGGWDGQIQLVKQWLSNLNRELKSPNKWDRLMKEIQSIHLSSQNSNEQEKFSVSEFQELKLKISHIQSKIDSIELTSEQSSAIHSKLDHLTEMAATMNKFDWKGLFIGTIVSVIIQLQVTPENATAIWNLIKSTFNNLLLP